jgi:hypothetical protein
VSLVVHLPQTSHAMLGRESFDGFAQRTLIGEACPGGGR